MRRALAVGLALACVPGRARAELCEDTTELLIGELAPCDGVLVGPRRLGGLLEDRELRRACGLELDAERKRSAIDARACDERVAIMAGAIDVADARADRFPWAHVLTSLALGMVAGAFAVGVLVAR